MRKDMMPFLDTLMIFLFFIGVPLGVILLILSKPVLAVFFLSASLIVFIILVFRENIRRSIRLERTANPRNRETLISNMALGFRNYLSNEVFGYSPFFRDATQVPPQPIYMKLRINGANFKDERFSFLGSTKNRSLLKEYILHPTEGAILITGFRGVGKTTLVENAIHEAKVKGAFIHIKITLSTKKEYFDILTEIIRQIAKQVSDGDFSISKKARDKIAHNCSLTRMKINDLVDVEGGFKLDTTNKSEAGVEAEFKTKTSRAIEYKELQIPDLEEAIQEITNCLMQEKNRIRVLCVFDEIDKLTNTPDGSPFFDNLLERLKNLIYSNPICFIFVSGIDVHEKFLGDHKKINSTYSSIFSRQIYVPCCWDTVMPYFDNIEEADKANVFLPLQASFHSLVSVQTIHRLNTLFEQIDRYIVLRGKGRPLDMFREFSCFISWEEEQAYFCVTKGKTEEITSIIRVYNKIFDIIQSEDYESEFERDAAFILSLALLDFLIESLIDEFDEETLVNAIITKSDISATSLRSKMQALLEKFCEKAILQKTESSQKYKVVDNSILHEKHPEISNYDEVAYSSSSAQFIDNKDKMLFENSINLDKKNKAYWDNIAFRRRLYSCKQYSIYLTDKKLAGRSQTEEQKIVILYTDMPIISYDFNPNDHKFAFAIDDSYLFASDKQFFASVNQLFASIHTVEEKDGIILSDLASAGLGRGTIFNILVQLHIIIDLVTKISLFSSECIALFHPDNILVFEDSSIKLLTRISQFLKLDSGSKESIYFSPFLREHASSDERRTALYYSVSAIAVYMLSGGRLQSRKDEKRDILSEKIRVLRCSKRLKKLLAQLVSPHFSANLSFHSSFVQSLRMCPEFLFFAVQEFYELRKPMVGNPLPYPGSSISPKQGMSNVGNTGIGDSSGYTTYLSERTVFDYDETYSVRTPYQSGNTIPTEEKPTLTVVSLNSTYTISNGMTTIGRDGNNSIQIQSRLISRCHARITYEDNKFYYIDLNSTNGSIINGEKVQPQEKNLLKDGDTITIADVETVFRLSKVPTHSTDKENEAEI